MDIKTIQVTGDNLSDIVFTLEVSENYFSKVWWNKRRSYWTRVRGNR